MTTTKKTEADHWRKAVEDSRNTIVWLEKRGDDKTARIRALEHRVKELEGAR